MKIFRQSTGQGHQVVRIIVGKVTRNTRFLVDGEWKGVLDAHKMKNSLKTNFRLWRIISNGDGKVLVRVCI
jgi:hypothetical protein